MRAVFVLAALFPVCFSRPACAQSSPFERKPDELRDIENLRRYQGLVGVYRSGDDRVVVELMTWNQGELAKLIAAINSTNDPGRPWSDDALRAGAVLHTAVALKWVDERDLDNAAVYLTLAVAQLRQASPASAAFASRWYYAISRILLSIGDAARAEHILETARAHLPSDPLVLYASGTMAEMRATQWQSAPADMRARSLTDTRPFDHILKNRTTRLQDAHEWLTAAVGAAPTPLARLHLARVLMMRSSNAEALAMLRDLSAPSHDRATRYLALLFTGAVQERDGRLAEAAAAYREAVACFREAQVAYIALSHVLQAAGKGDEARAVLRTLLESGGGGREPWSWYFTEPVSVARERMAEVMNEGRR